MFGMKRASKKYLALLHTAYHEAGHAFADWKFGFKVKRASIAPKGDSSGRVFTKTRLHMRSLEYMDPSGARIGKIHEQIVSLLAGRAAQRRFKPQSIRSYHAESDLHKVTELLFRLHSKNEVKHVFNYLETKARNFVKHHQNWEVISDLAKALMKNITMKGPEIEQAIKQSYQRQFELLSKKP